MACRMRYGLSVYDFAVKGDYRRSVRNDRNRSQRIQGGVLVKVGQGIKKSAHARPRLLFDSHHPLGLCFLLFLNTVFALGQDKS